ncbi:MAG: glycosyltransferase family 8 protein [Puniceicoccales bacterium]|nr:glycosyltransferase family 8 protein [Puniceicoccales bacterium]
MPDQINIAFVFDDKFVDLFRVAVYSIAKNTASNLAIYVVDCGISDESKEKVLRLTKRCANIVIVKIGAPKRVEALEKFPIPQHFSSAVFYRLAISKIFPNLTRVIYLDCDTVVDGDIVELWNEDLAGRPFGVVEEDGNFFPNKTKLRRQKELGLGEEKRYYNSGVLLINCQEFERAKVFERAIGQVKNTSVPLLCPEQDAMNVCLENNEHMPLSPRYNFIPFTPLYYEVLKKINPLIIHYASTKPWQINRRLIKLLHFCGMFRSSSKILLKFWEYADAAAFKGMQSSSVDVTLKFLYKRAFQPIERAISGVCGNMASIAAKHFKFTAK